MKLASMDNFRCLMERYLVKRTKNKEINNGPKKNGHTRIRTLNMQKLTSQRAVTKPLLVYKSFRKCRGQSSGFIGVFGCDDWDLLVSHDGESDLNPIW